MTAPLTERLGNAAVRTGEFWPNGTIPALLRETKAALEAHALEIEAYTALLEAAEARVATLTGALRWLGDNVYDARDVLAGTDEGAE